MSVLQYTYLGDKIHHHSSTRALPWHMPPSGKLYVGIWKIRLRENWNMMKIDDPQ
jgi:hypothetical protein